MNKLSLTQVSPAQGAPDAPAPADDEIDLAALLATLWRGRLWIALTALLAMAVGAWYSFGLAVPRYTSSAVVVLDERQEQVSGLEGVMSGLSGDQTSINTEVEVMRSRGLIEKLVTTLDLTADPEFNAELRSEPPLSVDRAVALLRGALGQPVDPDVPLSAREILDATIDEVLEQLSITNLRQSYVFRLTVETEAAEKSARIANALADLYVRDQLEVKFAANAQASTWLTDRVAELQVELEAAEVKVKSFSSGSDLISAETLEALNRQLKELRDRLAAAEETRVLAEARRAALAAAARTGDRAQMAVVAGDRALTRALARAGTEAGAAGFDARFAQVQLLAAQEAARAAEQITAFNASIATLEADIAAQSEELVTLRQLEREAEASRLIYEFFLTRLKETQVQQGIQQADSRVLSRAVVPREPSFPRPAMVLALALVLGLVTGSAGVLWREMRHTGLRSAAETEALTGLTVLGQIPKIPARRRADVLTYLVDKPASAAAEAVRNLRTSVLLSNVDTPPQIIMTTSSVPGEGKTTLSLALAQNLTGLGKKVLLIEGDLRRRVFAEYFDIGDHKGLLSVLSGETPLEAAAVHNDRLGADVLVAEPSQVNAADVFSSDRFTGFLDGLRSRYDVVLIDTPPVLAVPDARVIGQSVDAILYAVKWDDTPRARLREGLRMFETVNLRVTGLVLGQIDPKGMKRYGHGDGGYGSYYTG